MQQKAGIRSGGEETATPTPGTNITPTPGQQAAAGTTNTGTEEGPARTTGNTAV